jgi:hypothetical protein
MGSPLLNNKNFPIKTRPTSQITVDGFKIFFEYRSPESLPIDIRVRNGYTSLSGVKKSPRNK